MLMVAGRRANPGWQGGGAERHTGDGNHRYAPVQLNARRAAAGVKGT